MAASTKTKMVLNWLRAAVIEAKAYLIPPIQKRSDK